MHRFFTLCFLGVGSLLFPGEDYLVMSKASKKTMSSEEVDASTFEEEQKSSPSHFQMGVNYTWVRISPEGLDATSGNLGGLQALYEYKIPENVYGALTLAWRQGSTDGSGTSRSLCYIDLQERLGYTFKPWREKWFLTLFTGLGYRHYGEDVKTTGNLVTFNYNEFYIPLGFLSEYRIDSTFFLGLNFTWMPQAYPTVKITPLNGARWILDGEIGNFRVALPFTYNFSKRHQAFILFEPYFEYWQDGKTTAQTTLGTALNIPQNTYLFAGANLNIGVRF